MFRFTLLFPLVVSALVGPSMVPSAKASDASQFPNTTQVTVMNDTNLTIVLSGGTGYAPDTVQPHTADFLIVYFDEHGIGCVHADSVDGAKHWDETVSYGNQVYLNP